MTLRRLWEWFPANAVTAFGTVWVKDRFRNNGVILHHESIHIGQQAKHPVWFWVSYLFCLPLGWNPWRMRWEAEAYAVDVRAGGDINEIADLLSGAGYGWCCRKKQAAEEIVKWL